MSFCPRCGASTTPGMSFCASCGSTVTASVPPAPTTSGIPADPTQVGAPRGPPGVAREPWLVLVLAFVTLGIYTIFYWWNTSKEVDAYAGKPGHAHNLIRIGTILGAVSAIGAAIALVSVIGTFAAMETTPPDEAALAGAVMGGFATVFLVIAALVTASVLLLIGKYRLWQMLEEDERRRAHPSPISAGLMLALVIAAWFVPFAGIVLPFVVLYITTDHLNQAWRAAPVA